MHNIADRYAVVVVSGKERWPRWVDALSGLAALILFGLLVRSLTRPALGLDLWAVIFAGGFVLLHYVVVERRRTRDRQRMLGLLQLLNREGDLRAMIKDVTDFMQAWTGCSAVGIRLRQGDDFPYYETRGFAKKFVQLESPLCARDLTGHVVRDACGNPVLECMCGNILCGRFDASKPFFSAKGSFWSNHTTKLQASTTEADRQARTRNRCNGEGYESVALIPLRTGNQTMGLLQFNDQRKGRFSQRKIRFLEEVADVIALSLGQRHAQEQLAQDEIGYRQIVETAVEGVLVLDGELRVEYMNARTA
ncbi:MAG TPA: GAF domain-containing protein, partial [Polyangia bacterium]